MLAAYTQTSAGLAYGRDFFESVYGLIKYVEQRPDWRALTRGRRTGDKQSQMENTSERQGRRLWNP